MMISSLNLPPPNQTAYERSKKLIQVIKSAMDERGGLLPFSNYMQYVLYHPTLGYYAQEKLPIGKEGDFTTAPELSPFFAKCFAHQCQEIFTHDRHLVILEIGPGSGQFACDLLNQLEKVNALPKQYYFYEQSRLVEKQQQKKLKENCPHLFDRLIWLNHLDDLQQGLSAIVIANEVLDALPFDCFSLKKRSILERYVTYHENQFQFKESPSKSIKFIEAMHDLNACFQFEDAYQSEIHLTLPSFIASLNQILMKGIVFFMDYGYNEREYYRPERNKGTLTCFYQHRFHDNPFLYPGLQDITSHVNFSAVLNSAKNLGFKLAGYTMQNHFLFNLGLTEIAEKEIQVVDSKFHFNILKEIKKLTFPNEMGEITKILALSKGIEIPLSGFDHFNKTHEL